MDDLDTPQFGLPFRLNADGTEVESVEQDSVEDVAACVEGFLRTPLGWYEEQPGYGFDAPVFEERVDLDAIRMQVEQWEDRADLLIEDGDIDLGGLVRNVNIDIGVSSDG